jgi:hypothetical protein
LPIDINIDNNKTGGWGLDIKKDETKNALYSIKVEKSFQKIFAINYNKGTLEYITKLSRFNYEEIKINNGYIYYLNNPSSSRYHIRKLSRIKNIKNLITFATMTYKLKHYFLIYYRIWEALLLTIYSYCLFAKNSIKVFCFSLNSKSLKKYGLYKRF